MCGATGASGRSSGSRRVITSSASARPITIQSGFASSIERKNPDTETPTRPTASAAAKRARSGSPRLRARLTDAIRLENVRLSISMKSPKPTTPSSVRLPRYMLCTYFPLLR